MSSLEQLRTALADRYTLERELGAGGMATVYLAEDLKHKRKVAIKVLKPELAAVLGAERFVQEITTTAALQHPHILPLFDSGTVVVGTGQGDPAALAKLGGGGAQPTTHLYYVMPFIDGETLRAKLDRETQLGIDESVRIIRDVADALEYAHSQGVIHRDIKPENILLHNGRPMVADFGIALALSAAAGGRMTETGMSLGTPHYMSPEQATAEKEIGPRSDIYSLASVCYEMLTGNPPHTGASAQQIIMKIIAEEPAAVTKLRKSVPPNVAAAVAKSLEKLPADRFESAKAFAEALGNPGFHGTTVVGSGGGHHPGGVSRRLFGVVAGIAVVASLLLLATAVARRGDTDAFPRHPLAADLIPPPGCAVVLGGAGGHSALSPDGAQLALIARCGSGTSLWLRSLATGAITDVAGTTDASYPFWSPDGGHLGFFQGGRLKRIDLANGLVRDLAPAPNGRGGSWGATDSIVYTPDLQSGLFIVSAEGGASAMRVAPSGAGDTAWSHRTPHLLPDGRSVVFISRRGFRESLLQVTDLGSGTPRVLLDGVSAASYTDGHLFYVRDNILFAHPFDPDAATFTGTPLAVAGGVAEAVFRSLGEFTIARTGRLVYHPTPEVRSRFVWYDVRTGGITEAAPPDEYGFGALSPDGRSLAALRRESARGVWALWFRDLETAQWQRSSYESPVGTGLPVWSHDSQRLYFAESGSSVAVLDASGSRLPDLHSGSARPISTISRDGSVMLGEQQVPESGWDIMRMRISGDSVLAEPLLVRPDNDLFPRLSPDGRAFSILSGTGERSVLIALVDRPLATRIAWSASATSHAWLGNHLFITTTDGALISVSVGPSLVLGAPVSLRTAPPNVQFVVGGSPDRLLLQVRTGTVESRLRVFDHWRTAMIGP
ncbi:MAG: protein kinase [Gemmatimonadales bacterium]|nr:protein kinase [Gemmatimonadales bacterium]MDZ4388134.1 protein kinase [Gemmatimonadales bacterium]